MTQTLHQTDQPVPAQPAANPCVTDSAAWHKLSQLAQNVPTLAQLFAADSERAETFNCVAGPLAWDYSKERVTTEVRSALIRLAEHCKVVERRDELFKGLPINATEGRSALHTALRGTLPQPSAMATEAAQAAAVERERVFRFTEAIRSGELRTTAQQRYTHAVVFGIGGSQRGPALLLEALAPYANGLKIRFVTSVDGAGLADALLAIDPTTTLFVVVSKTFGTDETMTNAETAFAWLASRLGEPAARAQFVAVSANAAAVARFGIAESQRFTLWDWVGGRFSLWSAVGLPVILALGAARWTELLAGAAWLDQHFLTAPIAQNLPIMAGLLGVWNRNFLGSTSNAVLPYCERLSRLPPYLQQLAMESNGKGVDLDGVPLKTRSAAVFWGESGTDGQHAFFQLLHQGTESVAVEFLAVRERIPMPGIDPVRAELHHVKAQANLLAQSEALAFGKTTKVARAALTSRVDAGQLSASRADWLAAHGTFPGNRQSSIWVLDRLDAYSLGALLALYEHRIFVESVLLNINAFDQWGVELGKVLATAHTEALLTNNEAAVNPAQKWAFRALRSNAQ